MENNKFIEKTHINENGDKQVVVYSVDSEGKTDIYKIYTVKKEIGTNDIKTKRVDNKKCIALKNKLRKMVRNVMKGLAAVTVIAALGLGYNAINNYYNAEKVDFMNSIDERVSELGEGRDPHNNDEYAKYIENELAKGLLSIDAANDELALFGMNDKDGNFEGRHSIGDGMSVPNTQFYYDTLKLNNAIERDSDEGLIDKRTEKMFSNLTHDAIYSGSDEKIISDIEKIVMNSDDLSLDDQKYMKDYCDSYVDYLCKEKGYNDDDSRVMKLKGYSAFFDSNVKVKGGTSK